MTDVPAAISAYWRDAFAGSGSADRRTAWCAVSDVLSPKRPAMILQTNDGRVRAVVRPDVAERIGIEDMGDPSIGVFRERLSAAGIALHDPDYLFYPPVGSHAAADRDTPARRLFDADRAAFEAFHRAASEQDRDDAFVEWDHWAVFGCFDGDRIVSAASMCLWDDGPIADLGVLTLPDARGKGFARAVVRSINGFARDQGHQPQYRCQRDNRASVALARSCGLTLFGTWIVAAGPLAQDS